MLHLTSCYVTKIIFYSLVVQCDNMSHVTCLRHVVMCHDVSLARKHLATVTFVFRFALCVCLHVSGSRLQFMIRLDVA